MTEIRYAFYSQSEQGHKGDEVYLRGVRSDGLDRTYFGTDLATAEKKIKASRELAKDYRLDQLTYDRLGGELVCHTKTLAKWPLPPRER